MRQLQNVPSILIAIIGVADYRAAPAANDVGNLACVGYSIGLTVAVCANDDNFLLSLFA